MPADVLQRLEPTEQQLFDCVRNVDDSRIASADYGSDQEKHMEALCEIVNGRMTVPIPYYPREVLELTRWDDEGNHFNRLFACTILLLAEAQPAGRGYDGAVDSTIINLVESAIELGTYASPPALRFLAWGLGPSRFEGATRAFAAVGLLILGVTLRRCDPEITEYLWSVIESHSEELTRHIAFRRSQRAETWLKMIREVLVHSPHTTEEIAIYGSLLVGHNGV